jgi:hypothetical protein
MTSLPSSGRVFVLGAGASAFAGYPLARDLLAFIRSSDFHEARLREKTGRLIDKLNRAEFQFARSVIRDPNGVANLEELLTYLELYHTFPGTPFAVDPWSLSDSDDIRSVITYRFLEYQYDLNNKAWRADAGPSAVSKVADAWARMIRPGDVILTFNWDILHDVILWRNGLWSYRDGYGFECSSQGLREQPSKTLILKLHGSVNWVQREDYHRVDYIADVKDFFPDSKDWDSRARYNEAQADSGRKLVLPTYLKDVSSNKVLLDMWTKAHRALTGARELIVVGYSLNAVDYPTRLLFGTALSENPKVKSVAVVSPDTGEWDGFLGQVNKRTHRIPKKFEDWVFNPTG